MHLLVQPMTLLKDQWVDAHFFPALLQAENKWAKEKGGQVLRVSSILDFWCDSVKVVGLWNWQAFPSILRLLIHFDMLQQFQEMGAMANDGNLKGRFAILSPESCSKVVRGVWHCSSLWDSGELLIECPYWSAPECFEAFSSRIFFISAWNTDNRLKMIWWLTRAGTCKSIQTLFWIGFNLKLNQLEHIVIITIWFMDVAFMNRWQWPARCGWLRWKKGRRDLGRSLAQKEKHDKMRQNDSTSQRPVENEENHLPVFWRFVWIR